MKCKKIQNKLNLYYYDLLEPGLQENIKKHLETCKDCQKKYQALIDNINVLDVVKKEINIKESFHNRILSDAQEIFNKKKGKRVCITLPKVYRIGLAFSFLIIFGLLYINHLKEKNQIGIIQTSNQVLINNTQVEKEKKLYKKATITVLKESSADLNKEGLYNIKIYANSKLSVTKKCEKENYCYINYGSAEFHVTKNKGKFTVETFNTIIKITGTKFKVTIDKEKNKTIVNLEEGHLKIINKDEPSQPIIVQNQEEIIIQSINKTANNNQPVKKRDESTVENGNSYLEKIYLKNGKTLIGTIIKQTKEKIIFLPQNSTKPLTFNNNELEKVEYIDKPVSK